MVKIFQNSQNSQHYWVAQNGPNGPDFKMVKVDKTFKRAQFVKVIPNGQDFSVAANGPDLKTAKMSKNLNNCQIGLPKRSKFENYPQRSRWSKRIKFKMTEIWSKF